MAKTSIEWADTVWNPVSGCTKVSEGCRNCYAERMVKRLAGRNGYRKDKPFQVTVHSDKFVEPLTWRKPRRVFVNSMSDLFHPDVEDDWILAAFVAMGLTYKHTGNMMEISPGHSLGIYKPRHTFMILTKRPRRMREFMSRLTSREPDEEWDRKTRICATRLAAMNGAVLPGNAILQFIKWIQEGLPGLWLGVSVENQAAADERIPLLLQIPAAVRFISAEPLLAPVSLRWLVAWDGKALNPKSNKTDEYDGLRKLDWVIVGGETGPGARPMHPDWVRDLRDQCQAAGVPFFFKSMGEWTTDYSELPNVGHRARTYLHGTEFCKVGKKMTGRLLDGHTWDELPEVLR